MFSPSKSYAAGLLADRLKQSRTQSFSGIIIRISKVSIALGTAILIVSVLIYNGFRNEIEKRIFSVGGQVSLRQFTAGTLYEERPLSRSDSFLRALKKMPEVAHIQSFAYKPALISTDAEVAGIVLKGVGKDFNMKAFGSNLSKPMASPPGEGEVWLSQKVCRQLSLQLGSEIFLFFLQNPPRYRKVKVTAIYQTGLEETDENLAFVQQSLIQEMNGWQTDQVGGFEVYMRQFSSFPSFLDRLTALLPYNIGVEPITETQIQLFEWLDVIGRNVLILFVLVSMVAGFNMSATLLIMVMERRQMVGVLKALGATNGFVRSIFIRNGAAIILQGMLWGNFLALMLGALQYYFNLIPLDPENYYLSSVPIAWNLWFIAGINAGVFVITWLVIFLPLYSVNAIRPAEALRSV